MGKVAYSSNLTISNLMICLQMVLRGAQILHGGAVRTFTEAHWTSEGTQLAEKDCNQRAQVKKTLLEMICYKDASYQGGC